MSLFTNYWLKKDTVMLLLKPQHTNPQLTQPKRPSRMPDVKRTELYAYLNGAMSTGEHFFIIAHNQSRFQIVDVVVSIYSTATILILDSDS